MVNYDKVMKELAQKGERIIKTYRAFEGDYRVITEDAAGRQTRYTVVEDGDRISLKVM